MTRRVVAIAVASVVCALTAGAEQVWPSSPPREFVRQWRRVEFGMTQQQVHALVGKPNSTNIKQHRDFWLFPAPTPLEFCTVEYDRDGRVTAIGGSPLFNER